MLFVDLLGFASLTENHPLQLDFIKDSEKTLSNIAMIISGQENPLPWIFTAFHRALQSAINLAVC